MRGRLFDIIGATAREKRIWMRTDCDGSPKCAGEIHIETMGMSGPEVEIHLTIEELKLIRGALAIAIREYEEIGEG